MENILSGAIVGFMVEVLIQGLLYGLMSMGVMMSYKVLDFADLSVDGTFPLGGAVSAILITMGVNPWLALLGSLIAGLVAGFMTGFFHVKLGIAGLLPGILIMTGLYSVNLWVTGGLPNVPIYKEANLFSTEWLVDLNLPDWLISNYKLIVMILLVLVVKLVIDWLLRTKVGYLMKVTGDNESLVTSLGHSVGAVKILGLSISNGIVALSGGVAVSVSRYYDITSGTGMVVLGLSSVILGTVLLSKLRIKQTTMVIAGSIMYRFIVALALWQGMEPRNMKLMTVIIFVAAILLNRFVSGKQEVI